MLLKYFRSASIAATVRTVDIAHQLKHFRKSTFDNAIFTNIEDLENFPKIADLMKKGGDAPLPT